MVWPAAAVLGDCCWHGLSAAQSAVSFAASLPPTCRESLAHAAMTCGGASPTYFTLGLVRLAWGWLLVGVLLGVLARHAAATLSGGPEQALPPDRAHAPLCVGETGEARCEWLQAVQEVAR